MSHAFFRSGKIGMNQIRGTLVISNQKRMSEGIPSLMYFELHKLDFWAIFRKCAKVNTALLKSAATKDPVYPVPTFLGLIIWNRW